MGNDLLRWVLSAAPLGSDRVDHVRDMHERIRRRQQQSAAFMEQSLEEQAEQIMRRHGARLPRREPRDEGVIADMLDDGDVGGGGGYAGASSRGGGGYSDEEDIQYDPQAGVVDPEVSEGFVGCFGVLTSQEDASLTQLAVGADAELPLGGANGCPRWRERLEARGCLRTD